MDDLPNFNAPCCNHSPTHRSNGMNRRAVGYELVGCATQWGLMLFGFGILTKFVAPLNLLSPTLYLGLYFDAAAKALIALVPSFTWLFIWDRQVRFYFRRRGK